MGFGFGFGFFLHTPSTVLSPVAPHLYEADAVPRLKHAQSFIHHLAFFQGSILKVLPQSFLNSRKKNLLYMCPPAS